MVPNPGQRHYRPSCCPLWVTVYKTRTACLLFPCTATAATREAETHIHTPQPSPHLHSAIGQIFFHNFSTNFHATKIREHKYLLLPTKPHRRENNPAGFYISINQNTRTGADKQRKMSESYPHSDSDATSSSGDEAEWLDTNQDDEHEKAPAIISLVDDRVFTDAAAMLEYCKEKTGLDFLGVRDSLGLDFHGMVKLINFSEFSYLSPGQLLRSRSS